MEVRATLRIVVGMAVLNALRIVGAGARGIIYAVFGTVLLAVVVSVGVAGHVWAHARDDDTSPADTILVLGAAQYDGRPSNWFAARLNHAADLYGRGVAPRIVTVGGKLAGDSYTEAEAGAAYLRDKGIPGDAISTLPTGSDTLESAKAFGTAAKENGWGSVVVVTDPAHSLRATEMVGDQGVPAHASPTREGPAVAGRSAQLSSIIHETGGLLYYKVTDKAGSDYTVDALNALADEATGP